MLSFKDSVARSEYHYVWSTKTEVHSIIIAYTDERSKFPTAAHASNYQEALFLFSMDDQINETRDDSPLC